jgi:endo-1,4-beta-xylanase
MKKQIFSVSFLAIAFASCSVAQKPTKTKSLKEAYSKYFLMGAAIGTEHIEEKIPEANTIIIKEFNAITPENIMKCEVIHPEWNRYDFTLADKIAAYAQKNNMKLNGHTLIWHSQLSPFVQQIKSADSLRMFMKEHIATVAGRYKGKIFSWDVVNEALNEDGTYRKSIFYNLLGEDFIVEAFKLAQQADPTAELYYNDFNIEYPKKRAGAIAIIKKLQAAGVRIDGVGIQGHWSLRSLPLQDVEESIKEFSALGIKVMFTEVDLSVLPNPWEVQGANINQTAGYSVEMDPYKNGLPDSVVEKFNKGYEDIFKLFIKYKNNISRVTFWGVNDAHTWLNDWPIRGRTNYPLLFDRKFNYKPAYYKIIALANN